MSENVQNNNNEVPAGTTCECGCWFGRNWKWFTPLLVVLLLILFGLLVGRGEIMNMLLSGMKLRSSEPYKLALEAVQADPAVIAKLGEPITPGGTLSGNLTDTDSQFFFDVTGPKGTAEVSAQARTFGNTWSFSQLEVKFADGSQVSIKTASEEGGLEEAPAWNP